MNVHTLHMGGCFTLHPHDVDSWNKPNSVQHIKCASKFKMNLDIESMSNKQTNKPPAYKTNKPSNHVTCVIVPCVILK